MNAKETIKLVNSMEKIEDVKSLLENEKNSKKPRKTVIDSCEERIGEISTGAKKESFEEIDFTPFMKKIPPFCRASNIIDFAVKYFGDKLDLEKTKHVDRDLVQIHLKNGQSVVLRGL